MARTPAGLAFMAMPESLAGFLPASARLDLLDYYDAGMADKSVKTRYEADASIAALDTLSMELTVGKAQRFTLSLLPTASGDTVYALITTYFTPVADSEMALYDANWQPLKRGWTEPVEKEWTANGKAPRELPFLLTEYTLQGDTLTLTDRTAQWDYREEAKTLRPHLVYVWDAKKRQFIKKK